MRRARGFTLVELLVALFALALLATMSWQGIDGMVRTRQATFERADELLALQTGLAQWHTDLDAITEFAPTPGLEWNGRVLRLTRRGSESPHAPARVVAWAHREGYLLRWQSPPLLTRGELDAAWREADQWARNPSDAARRAEVAVLPLQDWQIFFYRNNAWTNPQSSGADTPAAPTPAAGATGRFARAANPAGRLPEGVRVLLELPAGRPIAGRLTRDWIRPTAER